MSYQFDKWTDEELVEHYREMQHLPIDVSSSEGIRDLAFFHGLVREMARRFAELIESNDEPEEAADDKAFSPDSEYIEPLEQEPTTKNNLGVDCISREAVERIINKWLSHSDYELKDHIYTMTKKIHNLTSVTPQKPRWIAAKDRLPKKGEYGDVLVTIIPTAGTLWATVMIAHYSDLMGIAKPCFHIGIVGKESFENITSQVIAWMPLPEPYKRESE